MMRFDRFTERAQEAAQRAAEIIQRYGHNQIDTEHILLALIEQPGGVIPQILEKLSINSAALVERLDATLRASPKANIFGGGAGQIFITPRVKRVVDMANEEANRLNDEYISTEHLFLAILSERNTAIARLLAEEGISRDRVYEAIKEKEKAMETFSIGIEQFRYYPLCHLYSCRLLGKDPAAKEACGVYLALDPRGEFREEAERRSK